MNMEMPPLNESSEKKVLEDLAKKIEALSPREHAVIHISSAEGVWNRDSTAYYVKYENGVLTLEIPDDKGVMERYESLDGSGTTFRNVITGEGVSLNFEFFE